MGLIKNTYSYSRILTRKCTNMPKNRKIFDKIVFVWYNMLTISIRGDKNEFRIN